MKSYLSQNYSVFQRNIRNRRKEIFDVFNKIIQYKNNKQQNNQSINKINNVKQLKSILKIQKQQDLQFTNKINIIIPYHSIKNKMNNRDKLFNKIQQQQKKENNRYLNYNLINSNLKDNIGYNQIDYNQNNRISKNKNNNKFPKLRQYKFTINLIQDQSLLQEYQIQYNSQNQDSQQKISIIQYNQQYQFQQKNKPLQEIKITIQISKYLFQIEQIQSSSNQNQVEIINVSVNIFQTGKAPLKDLINQIYKHKLIKFDLYNQFIINYKQHHISEFVQKFYTGQLHNFNFKKIKFTLLDHRRISQLLINLFPEKYQKGVIRHPNLQIHIFMNKMYEMSGQEYYYLYQQIDNISKIKWWSKILIVQQHKLVSNNQERIITKQKTEKAQQAIEQVIQKFKLKQNQRSNQNTQNQDLDNFGKNKKIKII